MGLWDHRKAAAKTDGQTPFLQGLTRDKSGQLIWTTGVSSSDSLYREPRLSGGGPPGASFSRQLLRARELGLAAVGGERIFEDSLVVFKLLDPAEH